jgi:hypothetical protein
MPLNSLHLLISNVWNKGGLLQYMKGILIAIEMLIMHVPHLEEYQFVESPGSGISYWIILCSH